MHNAILEDEKTGEKIKLWAVLSEKLRFPNKLTSQPIDINTQDTNRALADHIHHEPMTLDVVLDLVGEPGESEGYEIEQYNKLVDFSNRDTTFKWTSYMFVNQTGYSQIVQPGLTIGGLGMTEFSAIKSNKKPINIIGARLKFQAVVFTEGGKAVDSEEVWDRGRQSLDDTGVSPWDLFSTAGGAAAGYAAGAAAVAAGMSVGWAIAIGAGAAVLATGAVSLLGSLPTMVGSVPYQRFVARVDGKDFEFWLRSNEDFNFVTFAIAHDGVPIINERRVVYGEDLLAGTTAPVLRGLHIVPLDPSGHENTVTPENLGRSVKLWVLKEK